MPQARSSVGCVLTAVAQSNGAAPVINHAWVGGVTATSMTCSYELAGAAVVRLAISAASNMSASTFGAASASLAKSKVSLAGLAAATSYYWGLEVDGQLSQTPLGNITTFPAAGSATTLRIAFGSCAFTNSNAVTFEQLRAEAPNLFIHLGDMHYSDITANTPSLFQAAYRAVLTPARQRDLYRNVPLAYTWDDHDFCGDNSSAASASRPAALTTYREWMPHYPMGLSGADNDTPIYQTFVIGKARVFLLDTRSSYSGATRLGAAQKAQFFADLAAATEVALLVVVGVPWISSAGTDTWFGVATERTEIADELHALNLTGRVILLAGDAHSSTYDDGTNSNYSASAPTGPIVLHAAPLDQANTGKGGPYSGAVINDSTNQYGLLTLTFGGTTTADFKSYSYNGSAWVQRLSVSFTLT
jgi:phosphodiesterase/alkaline phosphatase D-like protein